MDILNNKTLLAKEIKQKGYKKLAHELGVGQTTVFRRMQKFRLTKHPKKWKSQEIKILKHNYHNESKLFTLLPTRTHSSIYHMAHKLNLSRKIKPRKHKIDLGFFKKYTQASSYVLGWMYSDGHISKDGCTFGFHLGRKDLKILEKIKSLLQSDHKIRINPTHIELRFHSLLMVEDLGKLGCESRKTKKIRFPKDIPKKYKLDFIRGYFDGDGSIMFNKPNTIKVNFTGNEQFIKELNKEIHTLLHIPLGKPTTHTKLNPNHRLVWQVYFYGNNARKLCYNMYKNANGLYLDRKYKRYTTHLRKRDTMSELVQYILINTGLKMSCGKACAQASHASVSVLDKVDKKVLDEWKQNGMKKIVLKVNSTEELVELFQNTKNAGLPCALITDAGRTQIASGSKTCFACGPVDEEAAAKYFSDLKLL
ncbi:MAG: aminoacyl-tRNA hydrolase [Candidatus Diapherotrites archaeon]|uniref:peptidyl-tRNA hydrolase n=1 Tax=Candidatus Iainarchaeum sp. TaxID=3101447 RepID=A0A8T5GFQ6_9ARCH|nr:aminoacyl-tRNA hydrolase [Candidatus Diapherotrites archaeon]MBT7241727.1 aminoacyl-tRNA hydrolase [Candidatus Diapherotrites archaeon]